MLEKIKKYRKKILFRQILGIVVSTSLLLFCITLVFLLTSVVVGWCQDLKIEGVLSQTLLISLIVILISVSAWVGYKMMFFSRKYNTAILRLDLLILKLEVNQVKGESHEWIERELQLITKVLDAF